MKKIIIVGVPRSGTTIVTRFLHSLKNCFMFNEPHWGMYLHGYIMDLGKPFELDLSKDFPIDEKISSMENGILIGFKETYRGYTGIKDYDNVDLIKRYIDFGYEPVFVLRNPIDTFIFSKLLMISIDNFVKNYLSFMDFIGQSKQVVHYKSFIEDPVLEISRIGYDPFSWSGMLRPMNSLLGDPKAKEYPFVDPTPVKKPINLSEYEKSELDKLVICYENYYSYCLQ